MDGAGGANQPDIYPHCWLCGQRVYSPKLQDVHYEGRHQVYFCSVDHWIDYVELKHL